MDNKEKEKIIQNLEILKKTIKTLDPKGELFSKQNNKINILKKELTLKKKNN